MPLPHHLHSTAGVGGKVRVGGGAIARCCRRQMSLTGECDISQERLSEDVVAALGPLLRPNTLPRGLRAFHVLHVDAWPLGMGVQCGNTLVVSFRAKQSGEQGPKCRKMDPTRLEVQAVAYRHERHVTWSGTADSTP